MIRGGIVSLPVADVDRAVRFYVETLGMKLVSLTGDGAAAVIDAGDGLRVELARSATRPPRGGVALGLVPKVPIEDAIAILENRGVVFGAGRRFADVDGNVLFLAAG